MALIGPVVALGDPLFSKGVDGGVSWELSGATGNQFAPAKAGSPREQRSMN